MDPDGARTHDYFGSSSRASIELFRRLDWAFRLYNEYTDIDSARLPILMPSSVYPLRDRDVLLSHTALYGSQALGAGGELESTHRDGQVGRR